MQRKILKGLLTAILAITAGCNTPYNNMKTGERLSVFRQECIAAGYGSIASECAAERNRQFEQLRNNQIAAGVGIAVLGVAAVSYCANHNCGGAPQRRYPGNCQYDWQLDAAGHRCGARSAWSRPGGY